MARGISIGDVKNKVQNINDNNVLPISTGADVPEVVEVGALKEHIQEGLDFYEKPSAGIPKNDLANDVKTSLGKADTALQSFTESDPTVPAWAKEAQKPSYSYSEITGKPNLSAVATSGDYEDLENTPTIPDVPEWAMTSTKPSYTVNEIDGAQEALESGVNIKTINGTSILGSGNITIQGDGGGDVNVIESITFNGSAIPVDANKNAAITYTETDPTVPSWAKASTKPPYTASEVGALPDTTVIPTESTVSEWGFTKNAGTVTSVTVNGSTYNPTNGNVNLGTIGGGNVSSTTINTIVTLTEAQYTALATKDSSTLYIITA